MSARDAYLKRKYGITQEDYNRMLEEQGGGCAICGSLPKKRQLNVDHNHKSGRIRGLLCFLCNYGIGWLKDNAEKAKAIAEYIKRDGHKREDPFPRLTISDGRTTLWTVVNRRIRK